MQRSVHRHRLAKTTCTTQPPGINSLTSSRLLHVDSWGDAVGYESCSAAAPFYSDNRHSFLVAPGRSIF